MFDSKEIAQKALKHAAHLSAEKKSRLNGLYNGAFTCLFAAVLVTTMVMISGGEEPDVVNIENTPIPLTELKVDELSDCPDCDPLWEEKCDSC